MRLGKGSAYAVLATAHIATFPRGTFVQGREIAEACHLPSGHLLKILQQLVRAQILASERGPMGGFALRREAAAISLLEIVEAIEGPLTGDASALNNTLADEVLRATLTSTFESMASSARAFLAAKTIADLHAPEPLRSLP